MRKIVRQGEWLYENSVPKPAYVIRTDFDFWYEIGKADGQLEPEEKPELNEEGFLYYICFRSDPSAQPGWVDSQGFKTIEEASTWASAQIISGVTWN